MSTTALTNGHVTGTAAESARPAWRPGAVFGASFAVLLALLLIRNLAVFTHHMAERGDAAANSIIIEQAKHFRLLVGNYSRVGFSHPGPAYFYICALGEWLGYDVLGIVPSPYNGQWLATLVLNAALVAAVFTVLWSWARSRRAMLWTAAAALVLIGLHGQMLSSTWMPYVYVPQYLLFLTAAASVAAGRTRHAWLVALAGALLVHGHAEFLLLFVPATALAVAAVLAYRYRRDGVPHPYPWRHWLGAGGVVALFLVPMVLDVVLHWPGEYRKYLTYGNKHSSAHSVVADLKYFLWFWAPWPVVGAALLVLLFGAAVYVARRHPDADLRRFLTSAVGVVALSCVLFAGYIGKGIDSLQPYIGMFFWATPMLLAVALVLGVSTRWRPGGRAGVLLPAAALSGALVYAAVSPVVPTPLDQLNTAPRVITALRTYAAGRPAVLTLEHDSWPVMTALLIDGERAGQRVCVQDRSWTFMVTKQLICTAREVTDGVPVALLLQPGGQTVSVVFGDTSMPLSASPTSL